MPKRWRSGGEIEAGASGGAGEGEARQAGAIDARVGALVEDDVDGEVLHRRVEQLLHHLRQAVDLVDEEDVALFEVGEDAYQVAAALQRGAGSALELHSQLGGDDAGEGRLS